MPMQTHPIPISLPGTFNHFYTLQNRVLSGVNNQERWQNNKYMCVCVGILSGAALDPMVSSLLTNQLALMAWPGEALRLTWSGMKNDAADGHRPPFAFLKQQHENKY